MSTAPVTILHVDNETSALNAVRRVLRKTPYQLVSVSNPFEAVLLAETMAFDLALLDVSMPGMNGFTLLKNLRKTHPHLPVVLLTGMVEDFVLYRAVLEDCQGYLEKPFDTEWLLQKIKLVLQQAKADGHQPTRYGKVKRHTGAVKPTKPPNPHGQAPRRTAR